ncbi:hypothetical protein PP175_00660 [Aneurinibacillus sp. Ricciae_BoGa-3]|uniref:hypothetical protein n=1 Tax=Aneurinibacillus sp. Ricciae_BoGa-3 TaxID=3022697 RepID=UPI002340A274|nr:hypothetical protein [Aneurinibacillus sp. Ricciae_BoGa-3]WCK54607.1 hypothetical protein PP175_00660 [Aneurinibacillus sp. Ricciae_BoGa-3]
MREKNSSKLDKNHTVYSHTLFYRYRWGFIMIGIQAVVLASSFLFAKQQLGATNTMMFHSLGFIPILWLLQGLSFFTFCYAAALSPRWHIDALVSPWGGWRTHNFLSIHHYQQLEWSFFMFGIAGSLFTAAWVGMVYGFFMFSFHFALSIPRILTIFRLQKWKKANSQLVIKHEHLGIGLYSI